MKRTILTGMAVALAFTAAQAQQAIDSPLSNKAPKVKERQVIRTSGVIDQSSKVQTKERHDAQVSTSATAPSATNSNRQHSATAPRLENKTYNAMSAQERSARVGEIEAIIIQNEGNPEFNREVYQKRIDLLREMK